MIRYQARRMFVPILIVAMLAAGTTEAHAEPSFVPNERDHSVVVDWIEAMLSAVESNPPAPTLTTWRMWIVTSAIYDVSALYDDTAIPTGPVPEIDRRLVERTSRDEAIAYAAHRALAELYPGQLDIFDAVLAHQGFSVDGPGASRPAAAVGASVADAVLARRANDGSNAAGGFAPVVSEMYPQPYAAANSADPADPTAVGNESFDPDRWTPLRVPTSPTDPVDSDDPTSYVDQKFLTPHWGAVEPFAMSAGDQFRPPPPPRLGSSALYVDALGTITTEDEAYREQAAEILNESGALGDHGKVLAEFWADGPHTWTPPGHWMQIAIGVSIRDGHNVAADAYMFMAVAGALLDAGIAAWDAKRTYDYVRPISAIRHLYAGMPVVAWGGEGHDGVIIDGRDWQPYQSPTFVTPPFAEYVSGHSTFSRAAAEVLVAVTGSDRLYDGTTGLGRDYDGDGVEDLVGRHVAVPGTLGFDDGPDTTVTLTWPTFGDAADEAGLSRRYGGIHFQDGDLRGREMGRRIGVLAHATANVLRSPIDAADSAMTADGLPPVLTLVAGRALTSALRASDLGHDRIACTRLDRVEHHVRRAGTPAPRLDEVLATIERAMECGG